MKRSINYWMSLIGARFGRLTITAFSHEYDSRKYYHCLCDCGATLIAPYKSLRSNNTKSCGCLKIDSIISRNKSVTKGEPPIKKKYKKEYTTWSGMKTRCYNKVDESYQYYGARGITVCDRWLESFKNFIEDMGAPPSPKHSIERVNNNGNYEKSNCIWATDLEQNNNKRNVILVEYKGKKQSLRGWCTELNKNYQTVYFRVSKGCTPIQALTLTGRIPPHYPVKKYMTDMQIPEL